MLSVRSACVVVGLACPAAAWADALVWYDDRFVGGSTSYNGNFPSISHTAFNTEDLVVNDGTVGFSPDSPLTGGHAVWDSRYSPGPPPPGLGGTFTSLRTFGALTARAAMNPGEFSQTFFAARTMLAITVTEESTWSFDGSLLLEAFGPSVAFNLTQARFDFNIYDFATNTSLNSITYVLAGEAAINQSVHHGGVFAPGDYLVSWDLFASADGLGLDMGAHGALDGTFSVVTLIPLPGGAGMGAAGLGLVGLGVWRRRARG